MPHSKNKQSYKSMNKYISSMIAGFVATIVLSLLMLMKQAMGLMPELNPIMMLSNMAHMKMGLPESMVVGWMAHFMIGTFVWGLTFSLLFKVLPGSCAISKGVAFSVLAWFLMMILPMPMSGAGLFGVNLGMMAPVMALGMHLVWGVVLGYVYGRLVSKG
ncbi:conserved hypothetical protein [Shewanella halifaxensis HAW-EB4]|uniref:Uncharacterized protein n=2 Tax=Shewanella halifaxensis TaxID=271098 RepID=B0TTF5_SHEHH|nr:conserved hypothetical protein [Shewanella halifaxensis HAW-EB4]